jgi:hypothetical protein
MSNFSVSDAASTSTPSNSDTYAQQKLIMFRPFDAVDRHRKTDEVSKMPTRSPAVQTKNTQ